MITNNYLQMVKKVKRDKATHTNKTRKLAKRVTKEGHSVKKVISKAEKEMKGIKAVLHLIILKKIAPLAVENLANLPTVRVLVQMKAVKRKDQMDNYDS